LHKYKKIAIFAPDKRKRNEKAFAKAFFRSQILTNVAIAISEKRIMDFRTKVEELVHEFLATREDLYLVDLKISASSDVTVILDGDESLTLQDCLDASRAIEFNLDREEHDFSLQVMSPGLSEPLNSLVSTKKYGQRSRYSVE
jgi:ribosome maturation factor RimP